jgi:uncharacterized protein
VQWKLINNNEGRTFAVVFEPGEEVVSSLQRFAQEYNLSAARFTAIGALRKATLGYYMLDKRDYHRIAIDEQVEVLSMTGNIALYHEQPRLHAHIVVGKRDGTAVGGHVLEAYVEPTLEVMLIEAPASLQREIDERTGLPLLRLEWNERIGASLKASHERIDQQVIT